MNSEVKSANEVIR